MAPVPFPAIVLLPNTIASPDTYWYTIADFLFVLEYSCIFHPLMKHGMPINSWPELCPTPPGSTIAVLCHHQQFPLWCLHESGSTRDVRYSLYTQFLSFLHATQTLQILLSWTVTLCIAAAAAWNVCPYALKRSIFALPSSSSYMSMTYPCQHCHCLTHHNHCLSGWAAKIHNIILLILVPSTKGIQCSKIPSTGIAEILDIMIQAT